MLPFERGLEVFDSLSGITVFKVPQSGTLHEILERFHKGLASAAVQSFMISPFMEGGRFPHV